MADYGTLITSPELPRIPSIPASQALRASSTALPPPSSSASASSVFSSAVPTGLERLDDAISSHLHSSSFGFALESTPSGTAASQVVTVNGFPRGSVAEVYGPPGVGKTALSLNAAVNALLAGQHVVWIDTGSPIPKPRLRELLTKKITKSVDKETDPSQTEKKLDEYMTNKFSHFRAPSLPHLLALLIHPPPDFPPDGTSLLIVDSISAPFQSYFPNVTEIKARLRLAGQTVEHNNSNNSNNNQQTQWLLNRKWNVTGDLANHLVKMAAARRIAVVLLNQTHTKIKGQPRPTLYPALAGASWENCVHTRVVVYRDWPSPQSLDYDDDLQKKRVRYVEVMKKAGKVISARTDENIVPFIIENDGLRELRMTQPLTDSSNLRNSPPPPPSSIPLPVSVRKRKVDEIADSEDEDFSDEGDEDFGWMEGEEEEEGKEE